MTLSMPVRFYERLGVSSGAELDALAAAFYRDMSAELAFQDQALKRALSETHAVSFDRLSEKLESEIARVAEAVVADVASKTALARRINASYMAYRKSLPAA
jgi:TRAP-type mannitol/chloroaromatic compound transport system substrate-binding protein